jgi:hypothetical protein
MTSIPVKDDFSPIGRWKTAEAFAMRRILTIYNSKGGIAAFRPLIQPGSGAKRKNHSTVFRVTEKMPEPLARAKAQNWRDGKEVELGLFGGATSVRAALPTSIGIYLVVTQTVPARALWSSRRLSSGRRIRVYIGKKCGFQKAYEIALAKVAEALGLPIPTSYPLAPVPTQEQLGQIQRIGIEIAPATA